MKNKAALTILLLFMCCSAAAGEEERPSYYYGSAPYEEAPVEFGAPRRPSYMPSEFGQRTAAQAPLPAQTRPAAPQSPAAQDGFVPYEYAKEKYSGAPKSAPAISPSPNPSPSVNVSQTEESAAPDADGFVPYEYAREKYSDYPPSR